MGVGGEKARLPWPSGRTSLRHVVTITQRSPMKLGPNMVNYLHSHFSLTVYLEEPTLRLCLSRLVVGFKWEPGVINILGDKILC